MTDSEPVANSPFRVGLTRDFLTPDGRVGWGDIGLSDLDAAPGVRWEFLAEDEAELSPEAVSGYDALIALLPRVTPETLRGADRLRLIARFGVGYDTIDVPACTRAGVLVTITPDGVRRPVATAALTLTLAVLHRLGVKDRLVRTGGWDRKLDHMGQGPTGKALGIVGWGNIGQELSALCEPLRMRQLAADPYADPARVARAGVRLVELDTLMAEADVVVVTCALTEATRHLIDGRRIESMKRTAHLVNVARGPIVDQTALTEALVAGRIAGAALDVFETEPPDPEDLLLELDNVILAPHAVAWTDELAAGNGGSAIRAVLDVASGRVPTTVVDRTVLAHPRLADLAPEHPTHPEHPAHADDPDYPTQTEHEEEAP